jgi:hypothetical protein
LPATAVGNRCRVLVGGSDRAASVAAATLLGATNVVGANSAALRGNLPRISGHRAQDTNGTSRLVAREST